MATTGQERARADLPRDRREHCVVGSRSAFVARRSSHRTARSPDDCNRRNSASLQKKLSEDAMGITSGTAAERGRVAYVFYDRAERFTPLHRGKYLGHFMAHELGHLLLPQYAHSVTGLMREIGRASCRDRV